MRRTQFQRSNEMTNRDFALLWEFAAKADPSLRSWQRSMPALKRKQLRVRPYTRARHFLRMMKGQASVFTNFSVPLKQEGLKDRRAVLLEVIGNGFPTRQTAGAQVHSSHCTRMKVSELIRRWERGRSIVSVTDLHFRETKF